MRINISLLLHVSLTTLLSVLPYTATATAATGTHENNLPESAEIYHWAVNAPQPSSLAKIAYNVDTLETKVLAYTPPDVEKENADNSQHYRIGFYRTAADGSKQWVGSLVSRAALTSPSPKHSMLQLHLSGSQQHELYHVSLSKSRDIDTDMSPESIGVELVYPGAGAMPELNKPLVVSPDGTGPPVELEKTFFQK